MKDEHLGSVAVGAGVGALAVGAYAGQRMLNWSHTPDAPTLPPEVVDVEAPPVEVEVVDEDPHARAGVVLGAMALIAYAASAGYKRLAGGPRFRQGRPGGPEDACMRYKAMRDIYKKENEKSWNLHIGPPRQYVRADGDYRPPQWVEDECESLLATYGSSARVLYVQGASLDEVKRLAYEREPVNIEMDSRDEMTIKYDKARLKMVFGYEYGAYDDLSSSGFPPQIAISCVTPVQDPQTSTRVDVAVVSLIGLAFDSPLQPDYIKLIKDHKLTDKKFVRQFMTQAYAMAFHAAKIANREFLCVSPIGNVSFKPPDYTTKEFEKDFVWPAVEAAHTLFRQANPGTQIKVERALFGHKIDDFNVPRCFFNHGRWSEKLDKRMFINAWDCWSMLGNGNEQDISADGYWGQSSAISLLGWPGSNPEISYEEVKKYE